MHLELELEALLPAESRIASGELCVNYWTLYLCNQMICLLKKVIRFNSIPAITCNHPFVHDL